MLSSVFDIAASALAAEEMRITLGAQNLANADTVATPGSPGLYQRRMAVFETTALGGDPAKLGVTVRAVLQDPNPPRLVYDPGNPIADARGFVAKPAINPVNEEVDVLEATRVYQSNLAAIETAKNAIISALNILK